MLCLLCMKDLINVTRDKMITCYADGTIVLFLGKEWVVTYKITEIETTIIKYWFDLNTLTTMYVT